MMTVRNIGLWVARVAKVLALLTFLLPWVVVSCNGDTMIAASGYQLATGTVQLPEIAVAPEGQGVAWWAMSAFVVIILGVVLGFVFKPIKRKATIMLATSALSIVLLVGGFSHMVLSMRAEVAEKIEDQQGDEGSLEAQLARMLRQSVQVEVNVQEGYWLAVVALLSAIAGSGVALAGSRREVEPVGVQGEQN